jgi:ribosome biogenesis GTPase A
MVRVRYSFGSRHTGRISNIKKQRGKYPDVMKDVVRISDIVLEILDARYIEETRNLEVEENILKKGKLLIYVFNKADLVDIKEMEKQIPNWMKPYVFVSATKGIGLKEIKTRIKMEAKRIVSARRGEAIETPKEKFSVNKDKKTRDKLAKATKGDIIKDLGKRRIHVGVIGYPNAGKSSVINFITRKGVAKTAKQAGFTKGMQKIRMSEGILILDTPGVIPTSKYTTDNKTAWNEDAKLGARTYSDVKDPEDVVYYLMTPPLPNDPKNITIGEKRAMAEAEKNAKAIEKFYKISASGDAEVLIEEFGRSKGFLVKGGEIDVDRTARLILRDWQEGNITNSK